MIEVDKIFKDKETAPIKEAKAFMKIREGMVMEGIKIFLSLMESIPFDKILKDDFLSKEEREKIMTFDKILEEIISTINRTKN